MKFILGKKISMTQKFQADGQVVPVTIVQAGPCFVTQVKTSEKDGYSAIQVGFGTKKKLNKPLSGHLKDSLKARYLKELRIQTEDKNTYAKGQNITVNVFTIGDIVDVTGHSKGRGFQGVIKRHGFHGADKTHGTKDQLRHPGSAGSTGVGHTFKGMRMAGRMGNDQVTIKNLEIIDIDPTQNLIFIKGAIPGARNGFVEIYADGEMKLEAVIKPEAPEKEKAPETVIVNEGKNDEKAEISKEKTENQESVKPNKE